MRKQFTLSENVGLTLLEANAVVDSGQPGKTRNLKGSGTKSITWVATGTYQVTMGHAYQRYLGGTAGFVSPVANPTTAVTAVTPGDVYVITSLGTTTQATWTAMGLAPGVTAQVGASFLAAATGTGTGTVGTPSDSGIASTEIVGDPNTTLNNSTTPCFFIQTLNSSGSPTDPTDGSVLGLNTWFRDSSVVGKGETPQFPGIG